MHLRQPSAALAALAALVTGLALLAGCGSGGGTTAPSPTPAAPTTYGPSTGAGAQYVAIGDSYTAGAALKPQVGGDGCLRSAINYPHLLVKQVRGFALDDVSCSGATTDSVLHGQTVGTSTLPPQVDALSDSTKLVTIGIGGNDEALFATLIGGCLQLRASDPSGSPCEKAGGGLAARDLAAIRTADDALVAAVAKKAPSARIVVVGYPQPLPSSGTCPTIAPIATGDYAFVNRVVAGLSDDLRAAAAAHGADFVDVARASRGHDLCSRHPWINGQHTSSTGAIPFHPLPAEEAAVASMIAGLLS